MKISFEVKEHFDVKPAVIYHAWLDSEEHSEMTGGEANCNNEIGGKFSAWDGYISGKNQELIQDKEIVQQWRTSDFDESDEDSHLHIKLNETENGCELTITHSNIPDRDADYEQGWQEHYFAPMKEYFS